MIFQLGGKWKRTPLEMSAWPSHVNIIAAASRERIKQALANGCYCQHDGKHSASLVMRNGAVWLQCDACGSSIGSAMARAEHPNWKTYPAWRVDLVEQYAKLFEEWRMGLPTSEDKDRERELAHARRRAEYEEWCRTSPEWKLIKESVLWRSRGHCEACIRGNADLVHHLSYLYGKIPPAWHLRAVCFSCHERLHTRGDQWCDYGMARGD